LDSSWRDFIFAEIWSRPELDLRSRYLITIPSAASADTPTELLAGNLRGALQQAGVPVDGQRQLHFRRNE
jgi:4-carboxymuconolactone decarboxylase